MPRPALHLAAAVIAAGRTARVAIARATVRALRVAAAPLALAAVVVALSAGAARADEFPPTPGGGELLWDGAKLVSAGDAARIADIQRQALAQHDTPIVVVTIYRMRDYTDRALTIEEFARRWFDHWGIGTATANKGILLLVSEGDRRARIELGADWAHGWDAHAQRVMDQTIVPAFKAGDFSRGIRAGVEALAEMAASGPRGQPPSPGLAERIGSSEAARTLTSTSLFPGNIILWMVLGGLALIVASFFFPEQRKTLLIAGFALIGIALFTYVVLIVLGLFARGRGGRGGGGFGGGGFGGGSSGGGGASGSW